jgi:ketosteroid isomerase-like protein
MTIQALFEKVYSEIAAGNFDGAVASLPENISFNVAGKSVLSGKYDKSTILSGYLTKLKELSGWDLKLEIHDVLVSPRHATVLLTYSMERKGQKTQLRSVHVWRLENEKIVAGYEYPRDMYQFDSVMI